jgi:hypothetical protein
MRPFSDFFNVAASRPAKSSRDTSYKTDARMAMPVAGDALENVEHLVLLPLWLWGARSLGVLGSLASGCQARILRHGVNTTATGKEIAERRQHG